MAEYVGDTTRIFTVFSKTKELSVIELEDKKTLKLKNKIDLEVITKHSEAA